MEPLERYEQALESYHARMWNAERTEFVNISKGRAWNLVPSVGLVLGLPSVNLNTGQVANYLERRQADKQKLGSLDMLYRVRFNEELQNLRVEYRKVVMKTQYLRLVLRRVADERRLYEIHREAHAKREMKPEEFYGKELAWFRTEEELQRRQEEITLLVFGLEKLSRYRMPDEPLVLTAK